MIPIGVFNTLVNAILVAMACAPFYAYATRHRSAVGRWFSLACALCLFGSYILATIAGLLGLQTFYITPIFMAVLVGIAIHRSRRFWRSLLMAAVGSYLFWIALRHLGKIVAIRVAHHVSQ